MSPNPSTWASGRPKTKKDIENYVALYYRYWDYISGDELFFIQSALKAVVTRTISLLTTDAKTRELICVSRETMKEVLKSINIGTKVLAKRSNAMADIMLATVEAAKRLAGNILTTKSVRLQIHMPPQDESDAS